MSRHDRSVGKPLRRMTEYFGLRRSMVGLLAMVVLVGMGEKMAERFLPIYLVALGAGPIIIGILQGMDNLLSALYSLPGGYLAQRIGIRRSLLLFNVIAMTGYAVVIVIPAWPAVIAGAAFFLSWSAISLPATMDLVSSALPKSKHVMGVSLHSLVRRVPMALGPVLGGLFIARWGEQDGVRHAFIAALAMAALAAAIQQVLIADQPRRTPAEPASIHPARLVRRMTPRLRGLLVSDTLIRFCEQIPDAFVVIWCMKTIAEPVTAPQFGLLTTIETTTAFLAYLPVAHFADRLGKRPFVLITFGFFTLFPVGLLLCRSFWPLVLAFILRGLKEFGEPSRKALIMELAPDNAKAAMFGLYYLIRDTFTAVAAFGGALLWRHSPETNLLTAFAFGAAGTVWFALRADRQKNEPDAFRRASDVRRESP
jgi:MFS family permease